jgi:kynurenine formamidase
MGPEPENHIAWADQGEVEMKGIGVVAATVILAAATITQALAQSEEHAATVETSRGLVPAPPWPQGDEHGMANTQGRGTWLRCAAHLSNPQARAYEVSHVRSNTMPLSPFGVPLTYDYRPTVGIPGTRHAFNGEQVVSGEPGAQGTQMDAIGHFAYLAEPWDGTGEFPADRAIYYGGFTQQDVKPTPDSPLRKLGIDKVPPIVTSAVLLDAKAHLGGGQPMQPGQLVTAKDVEDMLEAQGMGWRGLLAGDVLYIYTGWGDNWNDPDQAKTYYTMGPGLSYDAVEYLEAKAIAVVALDNPFTDPVNEGALQGKAGPPAGTPPALPFAIHHYNLTKSGIHQIQNANLRELAKDKVWTSCTIILPLRSRGGSGSPVRPVAIGAPNLQP